MTNKTLTVTIKYQCPDDYKLDEHDVCIALMSMFSTNVVYLEVEARNNGLREALEPFVDPKSRSATTNPAWVSLRIKATDMAKATAAYFPVPAKAISTEMYKHGFDGVLAVLDEALCKHKIFLFNNGMVVPHSYDCFAMAEDGTVLGRHICSNSSLMKWDLHDREDRKTACEAHYPDGYELVIVPDLEVATHAGLTAARAKNKEKRA